MFLSSIPSISISRHFKNIDNTERYYFKCIRQHEYKKYITFDFILICMDIISSMMYIHVLELLFLVKPHPCAFTEMCGINKKEKYQK